MPRSNAPEHDLGDVLNALPENTSPDVRYVLRCWPLPDSSGVQAAVELCWIAPDGATTVYKRWGERLGRAKGASVMGAWYRAAMRAHLEVGEVSAKDLRNLVLWECDKPRT